jgi:hypothetical protein
MFSDVFLGVKSHIILYRWGYPFLYESYLYHLHRLDHRHNFSPYFYLTYLTYPSSSAPATTATLSLWGRIVRSPLVSFVPQMGLTIGQGLLFGRRSQDLVFTWFVQTVTFVLFNKVCTSQVCITLLTFYVPAEYSFTNDSTSCGISCSFRCSSPAYQLHRAEGWHTLPCGWRHKCCG